MSNKETTLQQEIRLALGQLPDLRMFRNQVGQLPDLRTGRPVQFGLAKGSSDLIGFKTIEVTSDMVGQKLAVFTSIEVKTAKGKLTPMQHNWLSCVRKAGGITGVARSVQDAIQIISNPISYLNERIKTRS
tara:strand:- start:205 stop:597 length:393 start_codon:yes stop_codon:yes gene_type:complete